MKRNSSVYLWTLLITAAASLAMLQCEEDSHRCNLMGTLDGVSVTVVSTAVGSTLPAGAYDLEMTFDDRTVHGTWQVDEAGGISDTAGNEGYSSFYLTPAVDGSGGIVIDMQFECPAKKLSMVEGVLSKDGTVVDEFSFVPTYNSSQPTEDNGEGCGKCYRMNDEQTTLTVPAEAKR